jgi:integrase
MKKEVTMETKKIEELIDRFFEGLTSNEEEKELYAFFEQKDIPEYLQKYKPVFAYFENGLQKVSPQPKKKRIWAWASVAASLLALIGLWFFYPKETQSSDNLYEGSYIIRKGVKITDPAIVRPEIEQALYCISMQEEISELMQDEFDDSELIELMYEQ